MLLKRSNDTCSIFLSLIRLTSLDVVRLVTVLSLVAKSVHLLLSLFLNTCQLTVDLVIFQSGFKRDFTLFTDLLALTRTVV